MTDLAIGLTSYLMSINLLAISLMAADKRLAVRGMRRIPEASLLLTAFLGGSPGTKWAQRHYRHKTRKQPFARQLNAILALQVLSVAIASVLMLSPDFRSVLADRASQLTGALVQG